MNKIGFNDNPFSVTSPEELTDEQMVKLFVDVFSDFSKIKLEGHTFIHGARGTGKSMMLRFLEPLVQMKSEKLGRTSDLPFYAVHIPIKNTQLDYIEFGRLSGSSYYLLAEHMMVMHCLVKFSESLRRVCGSHCQTKEVQMFYEGVFLKLLNLAGFAPPHQCSHTSSCYDYFSQIKDIGDSLFLEAKRYLSLLTFRKDVLPYEGTLCGWLDFFVPLIIEAKKLSFLPDGPVFLMLDDADNLPIKMQEVLNSWVSCRTTGSICLKISTQLRYKTFRTISGNYIESPHDYTEIDITKFYSSKTTKFYDRIHEIVNKRLSIYGIHVDAEDFFPPNELQEQKLELIRDEIREKHARGEGRAERVADDITRYTRPEFIRRLGKSAHTYSYAGFKSLSDLAAGVVRWFLEPAAMMYGEIENSHIQPIPKIPCEVQDSVIKKWSESFLSTDFKKFKDSIDESEELDRARKLYNLINALGGLFQLIVKTESLSERRIFTIMLSDEADPEVDSILKLGVEWGYFQRYTIGSKEGIGRNDRFILSRRLGPHFKLDVSGFAGNLSVTNNALKTALLSPKLFIKERFDQLVSHPGEEQALLF